MSYKRKIKTVQYASSDLLTKMLIGIGIKIGDMVGVKNPNIEDTIISAVLEGIASDYRTLSLITNWIEIHFERINVDRLFRAAQEIDESQARAYFANLAFMLTPDRRFEKFKKLYKGDKILLGQNKEYSYLVDRHGLDGRFEKGKLIIAQKTLRDRKEDILSIQDLAKLHKIYYYRLLIGPTYRADMMATLNLNPNLSISDLARTTYGSFATAWAVMNDYKFLNTVLD